jgi:two-component system sensor histidine kinase KdpD
MFRFTPLGVWAAAFAAMFALDGRLDLANLALILVLGAAVAAFWLPALLSVPTCAVAVLAFNFAFVPPRHSFTVDVGQHAWLLVTMLAVSASISLLVGRQKLMTLREERHVRQVEQLRALGDALHEDDDPLQRVDILRQALQALTGAPVALMMLRQALPAADDMRAVQVVGDTDADNLAGLWLSLRGSHAFGPGTGRHQELPAWYLPMRGRSGSHGAAMLALPLPPPDAEPLREHAQALCDQLGLALERSLTLRGAAQAREEAQSQQLRSTLLAAIAHDYRTPLATLMSAASSLHDQADRLSPEQRRKLAATIVDEADQLDRITSNTLQLVRLDAPGLSLRLEWESAEELVGSVLRRARQRDPGRRVRSRLEAELPLLRCDAVLLVQMLDNLVDNALKHTPESTPVEILVRRAGRHELLVAVRDRGPGVPPADRERIFEVFQRGNSNSDPRRGAGVGLAVCRAIARVHGGSLSVRARGHGGASFECLLPLTEPPAGEGGQG